MLKPCSIAALLLLSLASLLTGCGTGAAVPLACSTGELRSSSSGNPQFTLTPVNPDLTIFPGQTEQVAIMIQPVSGATGTGATGTVTLTGVPSVPGLSFAGPVTGSIGSTVNLTVTAALNVASACFPGAQGIFTAGRALGVRGTDASGGSSNTQMALTIVLENPAFLPTATNLPVMTINTAGGAPIVSEDDYVNATLTIKDPTHSSNNYTGSMEIKGHGNTTWAMPKKPYRLNLTSKAPLLGMTSDTNWILLANYDDKSLLRTDLSFKISQIFGMPWTPGNAFTELYLNGVYEGTYQLTEKVEVSKARLNIGSMDDTDNSGTDLTGGYLGEIDHYDGETFMTTSPIAKLPVGIADPDPPTSTQSAYFVSAFNAAEQSMYTPNFADPSTGWQSTWNASSVVDYFLAEELAGNQDEDDWSSDYLYKPRNDSRFYRGPVWDMDITLGNDNYGAIQDPSVPWVRTQTAWYVQLFKDPAFVAMVKAQWAAIRPQVLQLSAYLDTRAAALTLAAQNNFNRWPNLGLKVFPNPVATGTYQGEITYLKSWLTARIAYMDSAYLQ